MKVSVHLERVKRYHREISHLVLKEASQNDAFKKRVISHIGQFQYLAPLLTSITLKQFRGLIEADKDLYAFKGDLPKPGKGLWVQLNQVEIGEGEIDIYYQLNRSQTRFNPFDYNRLQVTYDRLYRWQMLLNNKDTHPITLAMTVTQIYQYDPLQQL